MTKKGAEAINFFWTIPTSIEATIAALLCTTLWLSILSIVTNCGSISFFVLWAPPYLTVLTSTLGSSYQLNNELQSWQQSLDTTREQTRCVWECGANRVLKNFDFFFLKWNFFYVFKLFWYADVKNDFKKNFILIHF
jgi:hypothetical protein